MAAFNPPPGYNPNATSGSFFAPVTAAHDRLFAEDQQTVDLGNGYEAVPIYQIRRKAPLSRNESAQAGLLNSWWTPKGADPSVHFAQRCPYVSVDNFCLLYNEAMYLAGQAPQLILGVWDKKNVMIYGTTQNVKGLVLAGGGHMERMGNKNWRPPYGGAVGINMSSALKKLEDGDPDLRAAADKELSEEIGIDKRNSTIVTQQLGFMDDVFSDPRAHYLRCIFLRWIDQPPKPSEELKSVLNVPINALLPLLNRQAKWITANQEELFLELNHDVLITLILRMPATQKFIANMKAFYAKKHQQAALNPMSLFDNNASAMCSSMAQ